MNPPDDGISLTVLALLALGGLAVFIAYRDPQLGEALGIGAAVITVLVLLLKGGRL
ncbi:hypothetical protein [Streptomyces sp. NPDC059994]|uniref:hypothetical protein n=1 Tax=Streptomyces sp. NPDC059994 TaxID=3347029 RepID=UPI00367EF445